jgi:hypothetical protein
MLVLLTFGWILFLAVSVAHASTFSFALTKSPTDTGSWYKPADGFQRQYPLGTVLTLELPTIDGTLQTVQNGTASITDFFLPDGINDPALGMYFQFGNVPSPIVGTVNVIGSQAVIGFANVSIPFERGSNSGNASPGTLLLNLTTEGTTIPDGCAGRVGDQVIPGIRLDLDTGALGLVASVCPYYTFDGENQITHDNAFRLALRGTVSVPECNDGVDNDGDGFTDFVGGDPGCADPDDSSENDPTVPCDDGADNDGDGRIDFDPVTFANPGDQDTPPSGSGDPGCFSPYSFTENPQCQDGVNNDRAQDPDPGHIDYDAGLSRNGVADPNGPDPQCVGKPWGQKEKTGCGLGAELVLLLPPVMWLPLRRRRRT